jgi:hypothetical protein
MPFKPGQSGNPAGTSPKRPFAEALRRALARAELEGDFRSLNSLATRLIEKALDGDVPALKEVADRVDGKVPQAIVGSDEHPPVTINLSSADGRL